MAKLTKEQIIRRNRRIRRTLSGAVFTIFAAIGVVAVVIFGAQLVVKAMDDSDEKAAYESLFETVVALDPTPFTMDGETVPDDLLLEAAIWAVVSNEDTNNYQRSDEGALILPALDVQTYANRMYYGYTLTHHSFTDVDMEFTYDEESQTYTLPLTSLIDSFYPVVDSISTLGNTRTLTVLYMRADSSGYFSGIRNPESDTVVKTMEYILKKEDGSYKLYEIRQVAQ